MQTGIREFKRDNKMKKADLIEFLNQIDAKSEYSKLVIIVFKYEGNHYYRYDFIFENQHIAYIISTHCIPVDALKELGDIDPRAASRIYLKSNFVDLNEYYLIHLVGINYISE